MPAGNTWAWRPMQRAAQSCGSSVAVPCGDHPCRRPRWNQPKAGVPGQPRADRRRPCIHTLSAAASSTANGTTRCAHRSVASGWHASSATRPGHPGAPGKPSASRAVPGARPCGCAHAPRHDLTTGQALPRRHHQTPAVTAGSATADPGRDSLSAASALPGARVGHDKLRGLDGVSGDGGLAGWPGAGLAAAVRAA